MSSPFARTYTSVAEVIKLYPHLPRESILLTQPILSPLPQPNELSIKPNRKRIKRSHFTTS